MDNLLKETKEAIKKSGHKIEDILFIGSEKSGHSCTWEEFEKLADVEYDGGYGASEVAQDLIIVFKEMQNKIKEYFKELQFDASKHSYEVRGKPLTSVSKTIHKYVEKVDFDKIAGFVAKKREITKAEVLAEWEAKKIASCNQGTLVHTFGENYYTGKQPTNGFDGLS